MHAVIQSLNRGRILAVTVIHGKSDSWSNWEFSRCVLKKCVNDSSQKQKTPSGRDRRRCSIQRRTDRSVLVTATTAATTTVTTATATSAAATTAAATTTATVATSTTTAFTGAGFIHRQGSALEFGAVQSTNCGFTTIRHFHETEAS